MSRIKASANILVYFAFQFLSVFILFGILNLFNGEVDTQSIKQWVLDNSLLFIGGVNACVLIIISIISRKYFRLKFRVAFKRLGYSIKTGIKGYFILLLATILLGMILSYFNLNDNTPENEKVVSGIISDNSVILSLLIVGILTPILEELIFRVSIMGVLVQDHPQKKWTVYIIAALIFALAHDSTIISNPSLTSLSLFLVYLVPSLVLCGLYKVSKHNILCVIIAHSLNNCMSIMMGVLIS